MNLNLSSLLSIPVVAVGSAFSSLSVLAQVRIDGTTSTTVTLTDTGVQIDSGNRSGDNLFHSFDEFSVPANTEAFFNNANDVVNIFSRVTGGNISNIDGILRANGAANLFLINPAGILLGENARLQLGGSFYGSTADSIIFPDGEFSATDLENPPLITINAPIGLGFRDDPNSITVRGNGNGVRTIESELIDTNEALRVDSNATIGLIGGELIFEDATIKTPGGNIELGSVAAGEVGLVAVENGFSFDYSEIDNFNDISLTGTSTVDASGLGSGNINVVGRNITLQDISRIEDNTLDNQTPGEINIFATEEINISGIVNDNNFVSGISSQVFPNATADGGDINIETRNLTIDDRATITTSTSGQGNAGKININASNSIFLDSETERIQIVSGVNPSGVGNGGDINIKTRDLTLGDRVSISASTSGRGNGGNIAIDASESVSIVSRGNISAIISGVNTDAVGNGGNINITTSALTLNNAAFLNATSSGQGNAGNVRINGRETVSFDLQNSDSINGIFTSVFSDSIANAGNIEINTGSLTLDNGASLNTGTSGLANAGNIIINATDNISLSNSSGFALNSLEGNGGNIELNTDSLTFDNGAFFSSGSSGQANAGNIAINATNNVSLSNNSGISVDASQGNPGNISMNIGSLTLQNGAFFTAGTLGQGNEGNIAINATDNIFLTNGSTTIVSGSESGSISVSAKNLFLSDSTFSNITLGSDSAEAQSGDIIIDLTEDLVLDGLDSNFFTAINLSNNLGTGNLGNIEINARNITFLNGGSITSSNNGVGNIGNITLTARENITFDGVEDISVSNLQGTSRSGITRFVSEGATGDTGAIELNAQNLTITNGATIQSGVGGTANGSDIKLKIANSIEISGFSVARANDLVLTVGSSIFSNVFPLGTGNSGNINIETQNLSLTDNGFIDTEILGRGNSGDINITAERITIDGAGNQAINLSSISSSANSDLTNSPSTQANGGNIVINTDFLSIINGGDITSDNSTIGQGNGGNIEINATEQISLDGTGVVLEEERENIVSSRISASTISEDVIGNGGGIEITTPQLILSDNALISTSTEGQGNAGIMNINATDILTLTGSSAIGASVTESAIGNAGNTQIKTSRLTISEGSQISSNTFGNGNAGNLTILATESIELRGVELRRSGLLVNAVETGGDGGDLQIITKDLSITNGAIISASNFPTLAGLGEPGTGEAGSINIEANNITLENEGRINTATQAGDKGNITLKVTEDIILRDNSVISTQALKDATGGNIEIDTEFIIAFPSRFDGNDIRADANQGQGGRIEITAESVFGIAESKTLNPLTNDINASSQVSGLEGTISINTPDINPLRTTLELPDNLISTNTLETTSACKVSSIEETSNLIIKGKGGILPQIINPLTANSLIIEHSTVSLNSIHQNRARNDGNPLVNTSDDRIKPAIETEETGKIYAARGIIQQEDGTIYLTAYPTSTKARITGATIASDCIE